MIISASVLNCDVEYNSVTVTEGKVGKVKGERLKVNK